MSHQSETSNGSWTIFFHSCICIITVIIWFILFSFCLLDDRQDLRQLIVNYNFNFSEIENNQNIILNGWKFGEILISWPITNLGLICVFTAILGSAARKINFLENLFVQKNANNIPCIGYYVGASVRGLIVYLLFLGGLLIFTENELRLANDFTILEYIRLTATISLLSLTAGLNPETLANLLQLIPGQSEGTGTEQ